MPAGVGYRGGKRLVERVISGPGYDPKTTAVLRAQHKTAKARSSENFTGYRSEMENFRLI